VDPDASEEVILYRTMLDLIKPKLVYLDLPLFMALLNLANHAELLQIVGEPPSQGEPERGLFPSSTTERRHVRSRAQRPGTGHQPPQQSDEVPIPAA
jgi:hypothetical protein